jgi:hypothetical protein
VQTRLKAKNPDRDDSVFGDFDIRNQSVAFILLIVVMGVFFVLLDQFGRRDLLWIWLIIGLPIAYYIRKWTQRS